MPGKFKNPEAYILQLPAERQVVIKKLRTIISKNLPKGFEEGILYNTEYEFNIVQFQDISLNFFHSVTALTILKYKIVLNYFILRIGII